MIQSTTPTELIYSSLADDEMMGELIEMFVNEIPDRINTLVNAFQENDQETLHRTAHQLKGAFGSYGFDELTAPATTLETLTGRPTPEAEIKQSLDSLISDCQRMTAAAKKA